MFQLTTPTYSELQLSPEGSQNDHVVYWHRTAPSPSSLRFVAAPTLLGVVRKINPSQPELPEWVYNGAILGVQGRVRCKTMTVQPSNPQPSSYYRRQL